MTTGMPDSKPGAALDAGDDDAFAATVVEEMLEGDDGEAVPGSVPPDERRRMGLSDGLVRLSLGIENTADLLADLEQALDRIDS